MAEFLSVSKDGAEELILESDCKLVLETVSPVGVLSQLGHGAHETAREELL